MDTKIMEDFCTGFIAYWQEQGYPKEIHYEANTKEQADYFINFIDTYMKTTDKPLSLTVSIKSADA
jgi:hypothetical protein